MSPSWAFSISAWIYISIFALSRFSSSESTCMLRIPPLFFPFLFSLLAGAMFFYHCRLSSFRGNQVILNVRGRVLWWLSVLWFWWLIKSAVPGAAGAWEEEKLRPMYLVVKKLCSIWLVAGKKRSCARGSWWLRRKAVSDAADARETKLYPMGLIARRATWGYCLQRYSPIGKNIKSGPVWQLSHPRLVLIGSFVHGATVTWRQNEWQYMPRRWTVTGLFGKASRCIQVRSTINILYIHTAYRSGWPNRFQIQPRPYQVNNFSSACHVGVRNSTISLIGG